MKVRLLSLVIAASCALNAGAQEGSELESNQQKASYAIGLQFGQSLKREGLELDMEALSLGIEDMLSGRGPRVSFETLQAGVEAFQQEQLAGREELAEQNRLAGEAFLAENGQREGVVSTDSGLQYEVVEAGEGDTPSAEDQVVVHYRGSLVSGEEFDSSHRRGEPTVLRVNQVIPGWQEALALMSPGAKWNVWIPSDLGYGANGAGNAIGPNETLVFEIELIEIRPTE